MKVSLNAEDIEQKTSQSFINDVSPYTDDKSPRKDTTSKADEKSGISAIQYSINIMKMCAGNGALAVPYAMQACGIIPGVILYIIFAYSYYHGSEILIRLKTCFDTSKVHSYSNLRSNSEYVKITFNLLGNGGYYLILFCILITLWGINVGTMIIMTNLLQNLPWESMGIHASETSLRITISIILMFIMFFFVSLNNTKQLSVISSFGLLTLFISFVILLIRGGIDYGLSSDLPLWPTSFSAMISNMGTLLYTLCFCFVIYPLYNDMKPTSKKNVNTATAVSLTLITIMYVVVCTVLMLMFKQDPEGLKDNVLLNLKSGSAESIIVSILMVITCGGNYPLLLLGIYEITEYSMPASDPKRFFIQGNKRYLSRYIQVLCITIVSILVPYFGVILNFIGSFTSTLAGQILPAILYLTYIKKSKLKVTTWEKVFNYIFICIFSVIMVTCTVLSLIDLVKSIGF
ncbi:hypothetical protein WA158_004826 [Blastocystis sp. Blastoise]